MARFEWQDLIWRASGNDWTPEARLLAAYLLSGPATNRIGCMKLSFATAAAQTGLGIDQVTQAIAAFHEQGFVRHDPLCGWVWIPDVLRVHGFSDEDEVRRALPELASVPRDAAFRTELVQVFRSSADRPGPQSAGEPGWLAGLLGEDRATQLAQRLSALNVAARKRLPGLPVMEAVRWRPLAGLAIATWDYMRRCKRFFADLIDARELRVLGLLTTICAILFVVFPGIDLGVAGWFFAPPRDFFIGASWLGGVFDTDIHYGMEWFLAAIAAVFIIGLVRRRPVLGLTPKRFLFIALSIALGAGLLTNVLLKDSWGRARPSQIVEFGGTKQFSPPFMRSDQCQKNCSFVSGDASLAASFMSFAVIADRHRRRWWLGLGSFTALVGFMRMARGSHFLSDVVFAVLFTLMVVFVLARLILQDRWRAWPHWKTTRERLRDL